MEDHQIYAKSIENTYKFLVEKKSIEYILFGEDPEQEIEPFFFFIDPNDEYSNEDIDVMIEYFAEQEEYEKCHELKLLKKEENVIAGVDFSKSIDLLNGLTIFK